MSATPTAQEVFDLAVAGVLKQGKRCVVRDPESDAVDFSFRGPNGTKCAAGFVFTDEEVAGMEVGFSAGEVVSQRAEGLLDHIRLLEDLQHTHDDRDVEDWPVCYRELATHYNLSPAVIDQWEAEQAGGDS